MKALAYFWCILFLLSFAQSVDASTTCTGGCTTEGDCEEDACRFVVTGAGFEDITGVMIKCYEDPMTSQWHWEEVSITH